MEASAISFLNIKLLFFGTEAASIGKTPVFIIEPDIWAVIWKPAFEFCPDRDDNNFCVSLIGSNCSAADLTKFIVGIKPAKMITNLPAS